MSKIYAKVYFMEKCFRDLLVTDINKARVILTGVPYDKNASVGKGASLAPQVLRELSYHLPAVDMNGHIISDCKIFDTGDLKCENNDCLTYFQKVQNHLLKTLKTEKFNLVLGGDHSIAIASEAAFYDYAVSKNKIPAIIHLDAHPDICDEYEGSKYSHACPIKRAIDYGYETNNIVLIGIRGFEEQEVKYFAEHQEIKVFTSSNIHTNGVQQVINYLKDKFDDRYMVYLSYDIDCNDPCFAPGTGTPEAFGANSEDVLSIIRFVIASLNVKMMDLVEIAPPLDINDITSWLGLKTLYEVFYELIK